MSSDTRKKFGAQGSFDGMMVNPLTIVIAEDDPEHPKFAAHEGRRKISRKMVDSIKKHGVLVPIGIYLDGTTSTAAWGRRRIRHARIAAQELADADALPRDADNKQKPFLVRAIQCSDPATASIIENHFRMAESPMADARLLNDAIMRNGMAQDEAFALFGFTKRKGEKMLRLLTLAPEIQVAVDRKEMPVDVALNISAKGQRTARRVLDQMKAPGGTGTGGEKARALANSVGRPDVRRVRPRHFFEALVQRLSTTPGLPPEVLSLARFLGGHDDAAAEHPELLEVLTACGWDPEAHRIKKPAKDAAANDTDADADESEAAE